MGSARPLGLNPAVFALLEVFFFLCYMAWHMHSDISGVSWRLGQHLHLCCCFAFFHLHDAQWRDEVEEKRATCHLLGSMGSMRSIDLVGPSILSALTVS